MTKPKKKPLDVTDEKVIAIAKLGIIAHGSPELDYLLTSTGLDKHPIIIEAFYKAGLKLI